MSATEATVAAPVEEVKVVETATEPAPATEAPAAEQPAPATEEVAPAAVRFFISFSQRVSFCFAGGTQGRRAQSCCEYPAHTQSRMQVDTFSFRNLLLRLPLMLPQSLPPRALLLSLPRKKPRP
jgi:hypothetical protein